MQQTFRGGSTSPNSGAAYAPRRGGRGGVEQFDNVSPPGTQQYNPLQPMLGRGGMRGGRGGAEPLPKTDALQNVHVGAAVAFNQAIAMNPPTLPLGAPQHKEPIRINSPPQRNEQGTAYSTPSQSVAQQASNTPTSHRHQPYAPALKSPILLADSAESPTNPLTPTGLGQPRMYPPRDTRVAPGQLYVDPNSATDSTQRHQHSSAYSSSAPRMQVVAGQPIRTGEKPPEPPSPPYAVPPSHNSSFASTLAGPRLRAPGPVTPNGTSYGSEMASAHGLGHQQRWSPNQPAGYGSQRPTPQCNFISPQGQGIVLPPPASVTSMKLPLAPAADGTSMAAQEQPLIRVGVSTADAQQQQRTQQRPITGTPPQGLMAPSVAVGFAATPPVPAVTIGRHPTAGVNRGGVIDATIAPPNPAQPIPLSDAGTASLNGAASAVGCPSEFKWFEDVQNMSPSAISFYEPALHGQQCPRSGLLHLLFLMSDRIADRADPTRGASIITQSAQSTKKSESRRWKYDLPCDASFGLFHVMKGSELVAQPPLDLCSSTASRPTQRRPLLVDGDLFVSNVLRALTNDDAYWYLVSTTPQMVVDLCAEAAEKLFVENDWEPKFVFSGIRCRDCELDSIPITGHVMRQQDRVWESLKRNIAFERVTTIRRYLRGRNPAQQLSPAGVNLAAVNLSRQLATGDAEQDEQFPVNELTPDGEICPHQDRAAATDNSENSALRAAFCHEIDLHPLVTEEIRDLCATHLRVSMNFEVVRAPQFAWTQISALASLAASPEGGLAAVGVYGPPEALLVDGIDTLIVGILAEGRCIALKKNEVLKAIYTPPDTPNEKATLTHAELAALVPDDRNLEVPPNLPPDVCDAIASRLTHRELTAAWIDLGLMVSTHPQLSGFKIHWPTDSPLSLGGNVLLDQFRYRTLAPVREIPAEVASTNDDEVLVSWWIKHCTQESGCARYRVWPLVHFGLDVPHHRSVNTASPDGTFLAFARKSKWRLMRGRAALMHSPVAAPGVLKPEPGVDLQDVLVAPFSRIRAAILGQDSSAEAVGVPRDIHTVIGNRLPQLLYYAHFVGIVRTSTLVLAAHGVLRNERPIADTFLLRRCIKGSSLALCCLIFEELLQVIEAETPSPDLNEQTQLRQGLMWAQWFFPPRLVRQRLQLSKVDEWPLDEFYELGTGTTAEDFPIDLHSALHLTRRGIVEDDLPVSYSTRRQFVSAVHLKLLDFLGYLVHPESQGCDCELSYFGKALADFPRLFNIPLDKLGQPSPLNDPVLRQMTPHYAQQVLLLIELVRTESVTGQVVVNVTGDNWDGVRKLQPGSSGVVMATETEPTPILVTPLERQCVLLASRVACLCPMIIHGPWRGIVDRDLTAFINMAQKMQGLMRLVADVYAATTLASGKYTGTLDELVEVGAELPMGTPQSAAGGCLMKFILDTPDDLGFGLTTAEERLALLAATFPCLLPSDIRREAFMQPRVDPLTGATESGAPDADPLNTSTGSQHSSSCPPGCPDDDSINVHCESVVKYMAGIIDELFAFWDVCMSTLIHLRELVLKNEGDAPTLPSSLHTHLDCMCELLRHTNDVVLRKKGLLLLTRNSESESDQSVIDNTTRASSVSATAGVPA